MAAVRWPPLEELQRINNLTVDGKAGRHPEQAFRITNATANTYSTLREYDEGSAVTTLQSALYELGYFDGPIDGIYGATTRMRCALSRSTIT